MADHFHAMQAAIADEGEDIAPTAMRDMAMRWLRYVKGSPRFTREARNKAASLLHTMEEANG